MNVYSKSQPLRSIKEVTMQLLSRRDHGQYELTQKLLLRGYAEEEICHVVQFCIEYGYLDELRYARSQIRQHLYRGHGKRRIVQELTQKRVIATIIEQALAEESPDWFEFAKLTAQKKFKGIKAVDSKAYAKQIRFMQYRGYTFEQIDYALN